MKEILRRIFWVVNHYRAKYKAKSRAGRWLKILQVA
jgi:hypothetical protein